MAYSKRIRPHRDSYVTKAKISIKSQSFVLHPRIMGPRKGEEWLCKF